MTSRDRVAILSIPLSVITPGLSFLASPAGKSAAAALDPAALQFVTRAAAVLAEAA